MSSIQRRRDMHDLAQALTMLDGFRADSLRKAIAKLEHSLGGLTKSDAKTSLGKQGVTTKLMRAALLVKKHSSQINEIVHAIGILLVLPHILEAGESVESLSLAAGNTGKGFDLETNKRIAEFTFIHWQGGSETVRQNKIFKDFYFLAEAKTTKKRELFVIGTVYPSRFFESRRALPSIHGSNRKLGTAFAAKYGKNIRTVRDHYLPRKHLVAIRDLTKIIPALAEPK